MLDELSQSKHFSDEGMILPDSLYNLVIRKRQLSNEDKIKAFQVMSETQTSSFVKSFRLVVLIFPITM